MAGRPQRHAKLEREAYGGYILRVGRRQALVFKDNRATGWSAYEIDQYGNQIDFDATVHDYNFRRLVKDMEARLSGPQVRNPYRWSVSSDAMGQVPHHANAEYMGAIIWLRPSTFLDLSAHLSQEGKRGGTISYAEQQWQQGGLVAPPQLYVQFVREDKNHDKVWRVVGHEGRHRTIVAQQSSDKEVPVFVIFYGEYGAIKGSKLTKEVVESFRGIQLAQEGALNMWEYVRFDKYWLHNVLHVRGVEYPCTLEQAMDAASGIAPKKSNPRQLVRNPYLHKFIPPGGKTYQYVYSEEDVAARHAKKAQKIEALKSKEKALRNAVKRDVAAGDDTALAVGLILTTYERPGNAESAKAGHYGVTGWECRHLSVDGKKAVIDYIGKSGVHQTKTVRDAWLVQALADKQKGCKRKGGKLLTVSAAAVNRYLDTFDVSAKDLRTFGANTEMQRELTAMRAAGPRLETLKPRDVAKTLKAEFMAALATVAGRLGHTTSVLRKQYLVAGIEPAYLQDGTVLRTFS